MRSVTRSAMTMVVSVLCVAAVGLTGCAQEETSERSAPREFKGDGCAPLPDKHLVKLEDDKKLATVDNIVPAINATVAEPALKEAVNRVSQSLDQFRLVRLNKATDVDKKSPQAAAEEFAATVKLTDGLTKGSGRKIIVGVSETNESQTLGFLYQIALTGAGYAATVQKIGARDLYEPALESNQIQVVPEYIGTLTEYLNKKVNGDKAVDLDYGDLDLTKQELAKLGAKVGLVFGNPAEANNQTAFAITKALADKYHIRTLSEFAEQCSGVATVLGGPPECPKREFCQVGLENSYGLAIGRFVSLDASGPQTKSGLTGGTVTIGLVYSSDAALAS